MIRGSRSVCMLVSLILTMTVAAGAFASGHDDARKEKTGILLVAFGSSMPEAQISFEKIDDMVRSAHPDLEVRWAYTSHIIRNIHAESGNQLDSPLQALARMSDQGFTHVVVQSLHTIPGEEYSKLVESARAFEGLPDGIQHIAIGAPLLSTTNDINEVADALLKILPKQRAKNDAVVFMGHGTHHPGNVYYASLQYTLSLKDAHVYVGTVEGWPELDDVLEQLAKNASKKVWLQPFMSVAGDHARNDMAGDEEDSWKSTLAAKGYQVETVLHGTAEYDALNRIWLDHLEAALKALK